MKRLSRHRGITLLEVTVVSGLMAVLAMLLSAAWIGVGRSSLDVIVRSKLFQEMDMAVTALSNDLGGSLGGPAGRLGEKTADRWVGWMMPTEDQLWLCFDGGEDPNGQPAWGPPDTVVVYQVESGTLVRWDQNAGTTFTVARNLEQLEIAAVGSEFISVKLTFNHRGVTRSCTLLARNP